MDEPTNDLDMETLELLEEMLLNYEGTLLLVSHDRVFLNNVVTSTLAFEGDGNICEYPGGYDDWIAQRPDPEKEPPKECQEKKAARSAQKPTALHKLGYMEKRELEALPQHIEKLETEQQQLFETVSEPDFYKKSKAVITRIQARLASVEEEIATTYERWEHLENINNP
jgi:ATP-binding cassette subfamily F protein uup